jgi:sorbitol/mannitol transport system substrate-binding protein
MRPTGRFSLRAAAAVSLACGVAATALFSSSAHAADNAAPVTLTVALAANPQMEAAEKLIGDFYQKNPNIKIKFETLPENELRPAVMKDVATGAGQFDIVMLGSYEVPLWAKKGWLTDLSQAYVNKDAAYDVNDLLTPIKDLMSYQGDMYGAPFYGSSSFMMYRKDLFAKAGLKMPLHPTWDQVATYASKLNDTSKGVSGICLRGVPGWGQNLAPLTTVINTFGGRWFDMQWQPQLTAPKTEGAINFYVDLLKKSGQPDAAKDGWQECLQLFTQGKAAMWYDDTVFAGPATAQAAPAVKGQIGFAFAPVKETKYSGWLWAWALSVPKTSKHQDESWKFISWATSKEYIKLAGAKVGWAQTPPGSRKSTYKLPGYAKAAADYATLTLESIENAKPLHPTVDPVPYTGVQYVSIPQFEEIGDFVSQQLAGAISGSQTVQQALDTSQQKTQAILSDEGHS